MKTIIQICAIKKAQIDFVPFPNAIAKNVILQQISLSTGNFLNQYGQDRFPKQDALYSIAFGWLLWLNSHSFFEWFCQEDPEFQ